MFVVRCEYGWVGDGEILLFRMHWVRDRSSEEVARIVRMMEEWSRDEFMAECQGSGRSFDSIEEFYEAKRAAKVVEASKREKKVLVRARRSQFSAQRNSLILALIERDGYVCAIDGCDVMSDLHIDHIKPLSKGGTDDLPNLRLLCQPHNSQKGDRES